MPIKTPPGWGELPPEVAYDLAHLADELDSAVPSKQLDRNVIIASWNIRELGRHNGHWETGPNDHPKRNLADLHYIAEIISRFDVVAVQEVQEGLQALRDIMLLLGPDWAFHVTDATFGDAGDRERLAYVYDLRRVRPSGLAGELVLTPEDLGQAPNPPAGGAGDGGGDGDGDNQPLVEGQAAQLVKTPYIVSFTTAGRPFVLTTVHIIWGDDSALPARAKEAAAVARMLIRAARPARRGETDEFQASMIALGDFNITGSDDVIYKALVDNGLQPDAETIDAPRTVSDKPSERIAYDQIAWFGQGQSGELKFRRRDGNTFPWDHHVLSDAHGDKTFRISDHYPLWIEFSVREAA